MAEVLCVLSQRYNGVLAKNVSILRIQTGLRSKVHWAKLAQGSREVQNPMSRIAERY